MSIALVVDAVCDLPDSFMQERGMKMLPIFLRVNDEVYVDDKDPQKLQDFYSKGLLSKGNSAESFAYSSEEIIELFQQQVIPHHSYAILQTASQKRSLIYENAQRASHTIMAGERSLRSRQGGPRRFGMRVMNSGSLFCGQGVLAAYTSDLIRQNLPKSKVLQLSSEMLNNIHSFVIPPSVTYVRDRARKKGDASVSLMAAMVARSLNITPVIFGRNDETETIAKVRGFEVTAHKLFQHACRYIKDGLLSPYVVVSIAGDLSNLTKLPGYQELVHTASAYKVRVLPCVMGLSSLNVGPGAIGLGFLAKDKGYLIDE